MPHHRRTDLLDAEGITVPFADHALLGTHALHLGSILRLEEVLPRDVESRSEVADVHQSLALELVQEVRIEPFGDEPAIQERRLAAVLGGDDAEEELAERPAR